MTARTYFFDGLGRPLRIPPRPPFSNADPQHALPHPLSRRADIPHIWLYDGLYRVSMWNRRPADLYLWVRANAYAGRLNAPLLDARFRRLRACSV